MDDGPGAELAATTCDVVTPGVRETYNRLAGGTDTLSAAE